MLRTNVTSSVTDHGAPPSWFTDLRTMAAPSCAAAQLFSKTLPWIRSRRAFFSSRRFLIVQALPRQARGLVT